MTFIDKIKSYMKPGEGLSQRTVRGGIWVFSANGVAEALRFARIVILARLLAPSDFGLMGIALLAMSALEHFTQSGFEKALIQKKGSAREYLDTAWTVNGLRGLVLCSLLVLGAPYLASFFNEPAARPIIQVVALSVFIKGWENVGKIYFDKELEFHKKFVYEVVGAAFGLIVSIAAVLILGNVWALVFGLLAGDVARFILSYLLHPYRPRPRLDLDKAGTLFSFGKWILASSVILYLLNEGGGIVVGKLLTAAALGLYQMAYRISNMPATHIARVITQVTFPAYSKLQDNLPRLREAYLKVLQLTALISIPLAGGIFILAPDFTRLFLTDKWMPMVPAMQVLAIFGLIRSIGALTGPLWQGVGKPYIPAYFQIGRLVLLAACIYPFTMWWGILGTACAVLASSIIIHTLGYPVVIRTIGCRPWALCRLVVFPLIMTAVMVAILVVVKSWLPYNIGIPFFLMFVVLGAIVYGVTIYFFERFLNYNLSVNLREMLNSFSMSKGSGEQV